MININFKETVNEGNTGFDPAVGEEDIFVLDVVGAGFDATTQTLVQSLDNFLGLGADYVISIGLVDDMGNPALDFLSTERCNAAGVPGFMVDDGDDTNNCIGVVTPEGGETTFTAQLGITGELLPMEMPEPGALGLLGIGLVGLGLARRRQRKV